MASAPLFPFRLWVNYAPTIGDFMRQIQLMHIMRYAQKDFTVTFYFGMVRFCSGTGILVSKCETYIELVKYISEKGNPFTCFEVVNGMEKIYNIYMKTNEW